MSTRKFKSLCVKLGYNPAVVTKLKQQHKKGAELSVEEFTPQWRDFCNTHTTWNCIFQLACEVGFTFK